MPRAQVLHIAGFLFSEFLWAGLVEEADFANPDGTVDRGVWTFKQGTNVQRAATEHYGCPDARMALMEVPAMGRASHWPSRTLYDDYMSYGSDRRLSSLTLAAMADLGYYHVDMGKAQCVAWGRGQGCAFLESRCATVTHDRSVAVPSADDCRGRDDWRNYDPYVTPVCGFGNDPCDHAYDATTGLCDAMCARDNNDNCSAPNVTLAYHDDHRHAHAHPSDGWFAFELFLFVFLLGAFGLALLLSYGIYDYGYGAVDQ